MLDYNDDRVFCRHCGRRITPRLVFRDGYPKSSWCPYCKNRVDEMSDPTAFFVLLAVIFAVIYFW